MKRQWKDYQIIILIGIITFGLIGLCNGSVPTCEYQLNGVMYPNTLDCSTYWVCEYERPTLVQCDEGLLYDTKLKVCNWWYAVDCGETPIGPTTENSVTTVESVTEETTTVLITSTTVEPETTAAPEPETTEAPERGTTEASEPETTSDSVPETTHASEPETSVPQLPETTTHPSIYPDCDNKNGQTFYPHLTDPSKYYICAGTYPIELQCPDTFLWYQEHISCVSTEIPEENCSQDEYSTHPEDEQYYYQCIDGKPVLSYCPANLKWNQDLLKCTEEAAVQPTYPNCNNTNGQIYYPHLADITKYYFCAGNYPVELPCPSKFQWYQVHERCIRTDIPESEEELINCSIEKYASHPADDQMYFECVDNKPIICVCPSDLKWSQELLECISEIPEEAQYPQCLNPEGQIYFPHLTDSSKYYICAGDFAIELSCPASFFWYQEYQSCVDTKLPEGEEEIIDCTANEQQYAPHSHDQQMYYSCIDETPVVMVCPGNLRWNQELLICTNEVEKYPQCKNNNGQIYFPHLTDISKYYICAGDFAIELTCPTNFIWNQVYQSCVRTETPESEEEPIDCTLDPELQYVPHLENDQLYYHCVDGRPIQMLCPADLKWNQELLKCTNELPASNYPQCDNPSGQIYFAHLTDSSKYYICAGTFAVELTCPSGFLWAQDYQSCAKTETSEQEIDIIDCSLENGPQSVPHGSNEQFYYLCIAERPVLLLCPSDLKWNNLLKKCTDEVTPEPAYPQCNNPSGQIYFPHLTDISKYYICAGEFAVELPCPTNFFWRQEHQSCVRSETPEDEEEILDCSIENLPQFAPHPEDDQLYYLCVEDKPVLMLCPSTLKWNQELLKCTDELPEPIYPQCNNPSGQIYFAHLTDSSKYYICAGDFAIELACPSEFLWVQDYQSCGKTEISEEITVIDCSLEDKPHSAPHEENAEFYYLCIAEKPVLMLCPSDLKWDDRLKKCTDEVIPEPVYPQCNNPIGQIYFPHLTDSSKYYICAGDFTIELPCPLGFLWSQDHQSCARTETPAEEQEIIDCTLENGPQSIPYKEDEQFYYLCIAERPILMLCPSDLKWDEAQQICTDEVTIQPQYPQCDNPTGQVYFPHLTDPGKYYICAGDFSIELPCPSGFLWSQDHASCVRTNNPEDEETVIDCLLENGPQSAPHPDNNQFYYLCIEKEPVLLICPSDLKWDQNLKICTDTGITDPEYPQCDNADGQIYFPHLIDANKYYICAGTIPIELSCPTDYVWNQNHQSCIADETPDEEYPLVCDKTESMVHPINTQKYFICLDHRPALIHCPSNAIWNDNVAKCMLEIVVEPNYPPCGTGETFYPHLTDPNQYYLCSGDYPLIMSCPNDYIWSTDVTSCIENIPVESNYPPCGTGQIFYPHLTDPNQYYLCSGDYPLIMSCPNDYIWSTEKISCVENITVPEQSTYPDCGGQETLFPHLTDVNKYYRCIGGEPYLMTCNDDYFWDAEVNACILNTEKTTTDVPEPICTEPDTFLPHLIDATKYYACVGSPPISILFTCIGNTFWITSLQRCESPDMINLPNVPSIEFPEPDCSKDEVFLTNYQDCNKYYICIGGILPLEFKCDNDTYWDPINSICVDENSNCFLK